MWDSNIQTTSRCAWRWRLSRNTVALLFEDESLEEFFDGLRNGKEENKVRFEEYLENLSTGVNNLHMVMDCDVILGGHMAPYLTEEDLAALHKKVRGKSAFSDEEGAAAA